MKGLVKWLAFCSLAAGLSAAIMLGPGRMYGLAQSQLFEGQVAHIRPLETEKQKITKSFLIELHGTTGEVHIFASSDQKWVMIRPKEWVRVRLYPAPLWSSRVGQWQNGTILSQITPPPPKPQDGATDAPPIKQDAAAPRATDPQAPSAEK